MPSPAGKPEGPRLRRKLQKVSRQRNSLPERPDSGVSDDFIYDKFDDSSLGKPQQANPPAHTWPHWSEYRRPSSTYSVKITPSAPALTRRKLNIPDVIPELSHLKMEDVKSHSSPVTHSSTVPATVTMRRQAKTPVYSIGQLEGTQLRIDTKSIDQPISVEELAEQYRALLISRQSMLKEPNTPPPLRHSGDSRFNIRREYSSDDLSEGSVSSAGTSDFSPISDAGTLVAFDEEAVYLKPEPLSPLSPIRHDFPSAYSDHDMPDNLSLQISLDLLARELSSVMSTPLNKPGSEAPSLQIWVMIEAYERLRDQLHGQFSSPQEKRTIEMMFDMWLRTLYTIHESMTRNDDASDSEYDTPSEY